MTIEDSEGNLNSLIGVKMQHTTSEPERPERPERPENSSA